MRYHWVSSNVKQSGYDDMVLLKSINENEIFNNLKKRFLDNYIYTYIGPVLIAINPYKEMPYFTEAEVNQYRGATQTENPPHIYALADAMYRNMVNDSENQCVIISGESGAGKTVSAKYIMSYVSKVSGGGSSTRVQHIKDIILQSNPLLEAFGNAKTLRNNNSSRFGKYVEIQFGRGGEPVGGKITNFLLEKSRVVGQTRNERNFHIFYQLCCHTDETLKKNLGLQQMSRFQYLSKSGCYEVDGVNDSQEFKDVLKAMQVINVSPENQTNIFNIIAGILHLGNVSFAEEANYAVLSDERFLEFPSYLFGIRKDGLKTKLTSRIIETKWAAKAEKIESTFNVQQAEYTRDALSKALYSRLFDYLVDEINNAMQNKSTDLVNTGILDIYGFEIFDQNGFEQFCINYVNEKLQQIFIELTLKAEQEEYKQENIKWTEIPYFNNKVVCDLIESKNQPVGIFSLCDDVVATMHATGDGADDQLLQKLGKTYSGHAHFSHNNHGFLVKHYAGDVAYSIDGFCEKNRDSLFQDLIDLMKTSTNQFIQNLFPEQQTGTTNKRPTTAGSKIKTQANQLVDKLMKCYPHYIRCVKPNDNKQPREVNESTVKHQIKYLGLAENIRVRRAGFAYRREFGKFIQRFGIVTNETRNWKGPLDVGIRKIMDSVNMEMDQWQMGKTKVFIKAPESLFLLEEVRERKYNDYALVLQKAFRKFNAVKYYQKLKLEASNIVLNKKERRRLSINRKFYGDYIGLDSFPGIKALLNKRENIEFAQKCWKYDRQFKRTTRDIVLTNRAIHIIGREEQKQQKRKVIVEVLKRRIEFNQIDRIVLSKYIDNFVLIYPKNDYATVLEIEYKTEFLTTLHKRYKELLTTFVNIVFVDSVDFPVKKEGWGGGGTRTVKFMKDPRVKDTVIKTSGKVLTVASPEGLANTTRPTENYYTLYNFKNEPWWPKFEQLRQKYGITIKSSQNIAKNEVYTQYTRNTERQPQQQQQQRQQYPQPQQLQQNQQKKQFPQQQQQQGLYENITKPPVAQRKPPPEPNLPKCRVLYDYHANDTDELTITTGQIIYIVAERDGGWWTGKLNGKEGLFPGNYVEKI